MEPDDFEEYNRNEQDDYRHELDEPLRWRECMYGCPDSEWVNTDYPIDALSICPYPEHWRDE